MRHGHHDGRGHGRDGHFRFGMDREELFLRRAMMGGGRGFGRGHGHGRGGFDPFGDDFFGGRGGHGGGGRKRYFDNNQLRLLLADLIRQEPRHGYELIREIETLSGGIYVPSPGMVYPALTLMTEMEHIAEQPSEGTRKRFAITPEGEAWLAENAQDRDDVLGRLKNLAAKAGMTADHAPVRRAMENLKAALRIRLQKEGADNDTILDVAALIDDAATRIERLK